MSAIYHPPSSCAFYRLASENGLSRLILIGAYTLTTLEQHLPTLTAEFSAYAQKKELYWDLTEIEQMDTTGVVLLWQGGIKSVLNT